MVLVKLKMYIQPIRLSHYYLIATQIMSADGFYCLR